MQVDDDAYDGIGAGMRAERQRRNLSIADVAATLRIQQTYLVALEEGWTDDLPGPTYAIGFLRTYSEFLGLDGEEIIRQFKREAALSPVERRLVFPEPLEEVRRPGLSLALISLLVAGAVYGGWIFLEQRDLAPIETVAEPPQRLEPYKAATDAEKPVEASPRETAALTTTTTTAETKAAMAPPSPEVGAGVPQAEQKLSGPKNAEAGEADTTAPLASLEPQKDPLQSATQAPMQPPGQASGQISEQSFDQAAVEVQATPSEGERAAAADVSGLANTADTADAAAQSDTAVSIGEMPVTANAATQDNETSTEGSAAGSAEMASNDRDDSAKPAIQEETASAVTMVEPSRAQPNALDASPLPLPAREGSDVDTAPAMPAIQASITPPPPPAAPSAPERPHFESSGEEASDNGAGVTSLTATSDSLGYRPQTFGASNRNVRVVLRARSESWVQIQGANNELLLTRMLRPGDSYHVPNRTDLVLMTGNAGAIEIMVDGEALGTLGPMGQVRRNIKLDAEQLRGQMQATESTRPEGR